MTISSRKSARMRAWRLRNADSQGEALAARSGACGAASNKPMLFKMLDLLAETVDRPDAKRASKMLVHPPSRPTDSKFPAAVGDRYLLRASTIAAPPTRRRRRVPPVLRAPA